MGLKNEAGKGVNAKPRKAMTKIKAAVNLINTKGTYQVQKDDT